MSQETVTPSQESEATPRAGVAVGGVVVGVVGLLAVVVAQLALVKPESSSPAGLLPPGLVELFDGLARVSVFLGATGCAVAMGVVALGLGLGGLAQRVDAWARGALLLGAIDVVLAARLILQVTP